MKQLGHFFSLWFVTLASADDMDRVVLSDEGTLSGTISSITPEQGLELESSISDSPLLLKKEALSKIIFSQADSKNKADYSEILELDNGDKLHGKIIDLDSTSIHFETTYTSTLIVPRRMTRSIDFGAKPQRLIYRGPGSINDWAENNNWESAGKTLTTEENGTISYPNILPEHFVLRFRLEWEGNPSLRFYFCDNHLKPHGDTDRYYFEFNSAGMQINRQTIGAQRRWTTIGSIRKKPLSFSDELVDVELRVDRSQGVIYTYINGNPEGRYRDHFEGLPDGSGIMLQSLAVGNSKNIISRIEIYDWDAISQIKSNESHDDPTQDSLISSDGERFSGSADTLVKLNKDRQGILFSSPHADDSFTIPMDRVSTLYFRKTEEPESLPNSECTASLANYGLLHLSDIQLKSEDLLGTHPILGRFTIDKSAIQKIEFISRDPSKKEATKAALDE